MACIYQFANGTYGKGKSEQTTDIKKARVFRQVGHALMAFGEQKYYTKGNCHYVLRTGDKLVMLDIINPKEIEV